MLRVLHPVQMHAGLNKSNGSSIMMLPTHVLKLPTGWVPGDSCREGREGAGHAVLPGAVALKLL